MRTDTRYVYFERHFYNKLCLHKINRFIIMIFYYFTRLIISVVCVRHILIHISPVVKN
jgi:hypothetical protein